MDLFFQKKLQVRIENCEKNDKQTWCKHKLANVSSVVLKQVSQNIYQFPGKKNGTHEIEAKCSSQSVDGAQTVKSHGIQNDTRGMSRGTRIVSVLLRRKQQYYWTNHDLFYPSY